MQLHPTRQVHHLCMFVGSQMQKCRDVIPSSSNASRSSSPEFVSFSHFNHWFLSPMRHDWSWFTTFHKLIRHDQPVLAWWFTTFNHSSPWATPRKMTTSHSERSTNRLMVSASVTDVNVDESRIVNYHHQPLSAIVHYQATGDSSQFSPSSTINYY